MCHQNGIAAELGKFLQHRTDAGRIGHHVVGDAVETDRLRRDGKPRIDQAVEGLVGQHALIDHPYRGQLHNFVTGRGVQPRGFGIQYHVAQFRQVALRPLPGGDAVKQSKIIELRTFRQQAGIDGTASVQWPAFRIGERQHVTRTAAVVFRNQGQAHLDETFFLLPGECNAKSAHLATPVLLIEIERFLQLLVEDIIVEELCEHPVQAHRTRRLQGLRRGLVEQHNTMIQRTHDNALT